MDITFNCDKCGQSITIDEAGAGQLVDCPGCGKPVEVPYKSTPLDGVARANLRPATTAPPIVIPKKEEYQTVIVERIQQLPLTVATAEEPLQVVITDIRVPFADRFRIVLEWVLASFAVSLVLGIIGLIIYAIFDHAANGAAR